MSLLHDSAAAVLMRARHYLSGGPRCECAPLDDIKVCYYLASMRRATSLFTRGQLNRQLSSAANRPFRILGLQQVAIGGLNKAPLTHLWEDVLGVKKLSTYVSEKENVDEDILQLGSGPLAVELDLMQPLKPDKAPKVHVPPLNHIGVWVDELHIAVAHLEAQGVRFAPGGIRKGASGHEVAFIHPRPSEDKPLCGQGVLLELVQAPSEVIAAHDAALVAGGSSQ